MYLKPLTHVFGLTSPHAFNYTSVEKTINSPLLTHKMELRQVW
jgi:hypothetical protein